MAPKEKKKKGSFCNAPVCGTVPEKDPIIRQRIEIFSTTKKRLAFWTEKTGLALFEKYKFIIKFVLIPITYIINVTNITFCGTKIFNSNECGRKQKNLNLGSPAS